MYEEYEEYRKFMLDTYEAVRDDMRVCVCVRERERECVSFCVCVRERERESVCVSFCVCVCAYCTMCV